MPDADGRLMHFILRPGSLRISNMFVLKTPRTFFHHSITSPRHLCSSQVGSLVPWDCPGRHGAAAAWQGVQTALGSTTLQAQQGPEVVRRLSVRSESWEERQTQASGSRWWANELGTPEPFRDVIIGWHFSFEFMKGPAINDAMFWNVLDGCTSIKDDKSLEKRYASM